LSSAGRRGALPNVVLMVLDAVRADALEPYGAPRGSSPVLAKLARQGLAVPDVRATAAWTLPSHTAMFTGTLARSLGLGQAPNQTPQSAAGTVRAERDRLLAAVLSQAGYVSRGLTTNVWVGPRAGFDAGFDEFVELTTSRHGALGGSLRSRLSWMREAVSARADDGAREAQQVLRTWLGRASDAPFFWFINVVECHSPYLPPKPYAGAGAFTRVRAAHEAQQYLTFEAIVRTALGQVTIPPGALERMRLLYASSLRYVDRWMGDMLGALQTAGVLDDTLVVVCSDHGENLGEGGKIAHSMSLDDRLLRVPLVVAGPGCEAFGGMRSLVELPFRIAQAVRLREHPWDAGLPAGLPVAQWDPFVLTEPALAELRNQWQLDDGAVRQLTEPLTCAIAGEFKLMRGADPEQEWLYDLRADPLELTPIRGGESISGRAGDLIGELRAALNHPDVQSSVDTTTAGAEDLAAEETADIERRMRLMGYL